jgi:hypothetical protein
LLASKLLEAGYAIRRTERDFELACVSRKLKEKFSKRTALIERICREEYIVIEAEGAGISFSGMIQVTRQVKDGRVLKVRRLEPGTHTVR